MTVLDRAVLAAPVTAAARALLGVHLVRDDASGRRVGRIVEVEAYDGPGDGASHARFGRTPRTEVMFGPPGIAYVYLVYGMYDCLNVVTGTDGVASAVLIRAIEPTEGLDLMRTGRATQRARRRGRPMGEDRTPDQRLASGPGLVGAAFGIDTSWTGTDLCSSTSTLRLERAAPGPARGKIVASPRVGVDHAGPDWALRPWRFSIVGHPSISRPER
ncbi:MAG: DNA-3-methyladenine glycosylase [Candidatus Limnocylindrales bacterium]